MAWLKVIAVGSAVVALCLWRRFIGGKMCTCKTVMKGKTILITGANTGLGKAVVCEFAKRHARVIMACRDLSKARAAAVDIRKVTDDGELIVKQLDLGSLRSVRKFADEITQEELRVDVLVNNAGVFQCPYTKTEDGFEMQMGVNHFGHFLLTNLLLDLIKRSAPSRIVVVSSTLMKNGRIDFSDINSEKLYDRQQAYYDSKLANVLFSRELARRLEGSDVGVHCVSPGMVNTELGRHRISPIMAIIWGPVARLLIKTPSQGCQTILHCSVAKELENVSGRFYRNCRESVWCDSACDETIARKLWETSERLVAG